MNDLGGSRLSRSAEALSRRVGSDVLVARLDAEDVHELSGGASSVWQALASPKTLERLIDDLAGLHGVQRSEIAAQVEECVTSLLNLGVVMSHPDPGDASPSAGGARP